MTVQMTDTLKIGRKYVSVKYSEDCEFDEKMNFIEMYFYSWLVLRVPVSANPPLPEKSPDIEENPDYNIICTANWRGYTACWEIKKDGKLYLINVSGKLRLKTKKPMFASWITGSLYFEQGYSYINRKLQESIIINVKNGICESVFLIKRPKKVESYGIEYLVDYFGLENDE